MKGKIVSRLEMAKRTPLSKIHELPEHFILDLVDGLSGSLSGPIISRWSAVLSTKNIEHRRLG